MLHMFEHKFRDKSLQDSRPEVSKQSNYKDNYS